MPVLGIGRIQLRSSSRRRAKVVIMAQVPSDQDASAARQLAAQPYGLAASEDTGRWRDEALCAETDPEAFFPEKGGSTREAKEVCADCSVQIECLEYALANDERFGVWGGLSERQRRRLARRTVS